MLERSAVLSFEVLSSNWIQGVGQNLADGNHDEALKAKKDGHPMSLRHGVTIIVGFQTSNRFRLNDMG